MEADEPLILTETDVAALIAALSLHGFAIDAHRALRLRFLADRAAGLTVPRWEAAVAVLVLTEQDPERYAAERARLTQAFRGFAATRRATPARTPLPEVAARSVAAPTKFARARLGLLFGLLLVAVAICVVTHLVEPPPDLPSPGDAGPAPTTAPATAPPSAGGIEWGTEPGTFAYPRLRIESTPPPRLHRWPFVLFGLVALGAAAYAATRRGRTEVVDSTEAGTAFKFRPAPPPAGDDRSDRYLERADRAALLQGVGRFASDEPSRQLDTGESARLTAAQGGILAVRFMPERIDREVWLWVDSTTEHRTPHIRRAVVEIERALTSAGLHVRVFRFYGQPTYLSGPKGRPDRLTDLADHRRAVRVALVTDGAEWTANLRHPVRSTDAESALAEVLLWPDLAFFDPSDDAFGLVSALRRRGTVPRALREIVDFLADRRVRIAPPLNPIEYRLLRACVAAYPAPLDEAVVHAAVRTLKLGVPVAALRTAGLTSTAGNRLEGGDALCAEDTSWAGEVFPKRLDAALAHWEAVSSAWIGACDPNDPKAAPTRDLRIQEQACVHLLSAEPAMIRAAAHALRTRVDRLAPPVKARIAHMAPQGRRQTGAGAIRLRWHWQDQDDDVRTWLDEIGLGSAVCAALTRRMARPNRVFAAAGFAAATGLALLGLAAFAPEPDDTRGPPELADEVVGEPSPDAIEPIIEPDPAGEYRIRYGRRVGTTAPLRRGDVVTLDWTGPPRSCVFETPGAPVQWACGRNAERPDAPGWSRAEVALAGSVDEETRRLAIALLDSGVATVVIFGRPGEGARPALTVARTDFEWPGPKVVAQDWARLSRALMPGGRMVALQTAWPGVLATNVQGRQLPIPARCDGDGACRPGLVRAPAGSFWMGSRDGEGDDDERPRHRVELSSFWVASTEVTQAQYEAVMGTNPSFFTPERGGGLQHPVEQVSWFMAVAYCNRLSELEGLIPAYRVTSPPGQAWPPTGDLAADKYPVVELVPEAEGYRLPTEAQWEYAARAGTETRYWSGDTEEDLSRVGWYASNSERKTHPVGEKPANAWGLHDVHGNVWEWCQDWYDTEAYGQHAPKDPSGPTGGRFRVGRGGSFSNVADWARAAYRYWDSPDFAARNLGFRPVRPAP